MAEPKGGETRTEMINRLIGPARDEVARLIKAEYGDRVAPSHEGVIVFDGRHRVTVTWGFWGDGNSWCRAKKADLQICSTVHGVRTRDHKQVRGKAETFPHAKVLPLVAEVLAEKVENAERGDAAAATVAEVRAALGLVEPPIDWPPREWIPSEHFDIRLDALAVPGGDLKVMGDGRVIARVVVDDAAETAALYKMLKERK